MVLFRVIALMIANPTGVLEGKKNYKYLFAVLSTSEQYLATAVDMAVVATAVATTAAATTPLLKTTVTPTTGSTRQAVRTTTPLP